MRARIWSRSTISAPNAATTNTVRNPSRSAVRADTKLTPSAMISRPAIPPTSVERLIRRAIRATRTTTTTPATAPVNRQPRPLYPNIASPMAISILPTGGCTTSPYPGLSSTPPFCSICQACGT
jgi:hypothetical protein